MLYRGLKFKYPTKQFRWGFWRQYLLDILLVECFNYRERPLVVGDEFRCQGWIWKRHLGGKKIASLQEDCWTTLHSILSSLFMGYGYRPFRLQWRQLEWQSGYSDSFFSPEKDLLILNIIENIVAIAYSDTFMVSQHCHCNRQGLYYQHLYAKSKEVRWCDARARGIVESPINNSESSLRPLPSLAPIRDLWSNWVFKIFPAFSLKILGSLSLLPPFSIPVRDIAWREEWYFMGTKYLHCCLTCCQVMVIYY